MTTIRAAEVFPPGDYLKEELEARGWTQKDLATIIGSSERLVSEVGNGKRSVTPETAKSLAEAFGTSAEFWMNLETAYRLSRPGVRSRRSPDCTPLRHAVLPRAGLRPGVAASGGLRSGRGAGAADRRDGAAGELQAGRSDVRAAGGVAMSDLKPCPFCGSADVFVDWDMVTCRGCDADGPVCDGPEAASDAWNTRADGWITDRDPEEEGLYLVSVGRHRATRYWFDGWELGKPDAWQPLAPAYVPGGEE